MRSDLGIRHANSADDVLDSVAKRPISSARVTVWSLRDPNKVAFGSSDEFGGVLIPPQRHQESAFLPWDTFSPQGAARIEAAGYRPLQINVMAGAAETPPVELTPMK